MMEAGGNLDQSLDEDPLGALEPVPRLFPPLVGLEEVPAVEGVAAVVERGPPCGGAGVIGLHQVAFLPPGVIESTQARSLFPTDHNGSTSSAATRAPAPSSAKAAVQP